MIAWRGNLSFCVSMPDKPDKFGVKLFMLCDLSNGYCSQVEIYHGTAQNPSQKGKIYDLEAYSAVPGKWTYTICGQLLHFPNIVSRLVPAADWCIRNNVCQP